MRSLKHEGIRVPAGFATTAFAYQQFLAVNGLEDRIRRLLDEKASGRASLAETGARIRELFGQSRFPEEIAEAIRAAYRALGDRLGRPNASVAVRSSATAEDLPEASFAGQQESFLNVRGEERLLEACRR